MRFSRVYVTALDANLYTFRSPTGIVFRTSIVFVICGHYYIPCISYSFDEESARTWDVDGWKERNRAHASRRNTAIIVLVFVV